LSAENWLEVFARDRILVLLPEVPPINEDVDIWRRLIPVLRAKEVDRASVLLATKGELGLFFTDRLMPPHGQQGRHQDHHNREHYEERCHRIAALPRLTL
jgi:hypothetical protein